MRWRSVAAVRIDDCMYEETPQIKNLVNEET